MRRGWKAHNWLGRQLSQGSGSESWGGTRGKAQRHKVSTTARTILWPGAKEDRAESSANVFVPNTEILHWNKEMYFAVQKERVFIRKPALMPLSVVSSKSGEEANTRGAGRRRGGHMRGLKRHSTVSGKFMSLWFLLYPFHTPSLGIIEEKTDEKSAKIRLA